MTEPRRPFAERAQYVTIDADVEKPLEGPLAEALARMRAAAPEFGIDEPDDDYDEQARAIEQRTRWDNAIPKRFREARLSDLDDETAATLYEWAEAEDDRNLILLGPVGTGKTHAAIAAARVRFDRGERIIFAPMVEILEALRPGGDGSTRTWRTCRLLIIDDLGAEKPSEWTGEQLYSLVNRRWLERLPTIITSNLPADDLATNIDERVFSRLVDDALAVRLGGDDRRRA